MILVIDNYDSFTYNLVQYLGEISDSEIEVKRNDSCSISEIKELKPDRIVISPGPGRPEKVGITSLVISEFAPLGIKIMGVCLGHQAIFQVYGGKIINNSILMHGKTSMVYHDEQGIYSGLTNPFRATRYHSLIAQEQSLPNCLEVTARSEEREIMGVRHKELPVEGVQFHPESIATYEGKKLLRNFLQC